MNDLIEQYRAQIEALQKELEKKNKHIEFANSLINELYEAMRKEQIANFEGTAAKEYFTWLNSVN
jgi:CRISPR/Cas system-associated endonuclease Cas1